MSASINRMMSPVASFNPHSIAYPLPRFSHNKGFKPDFSTICLVLSVELLSTMIISSTIFESFTRCITLAMFFSSLSAGIITLILFIIHLA